MKWKDGCWAVTKFDLEHAVSLLPLLLQTGDATGIIICDWRITELNRPLNLKEHLFCALADRKVAIPVHRHRSPLCGHLCLSLPRQTYPCIRCSCEAPHGRGCKSSKRVQLSWQDAWELSSHLATQEGPFSLQSVPWALCSLKQHCLMSVEKFMIS